VKNFLNVVKTESGAHQPPIQWVQGVLSPRVKRPGHEGSLVPFPLTWRVNWSECEVTTHRSLVSMNPRSFTSVATLSCRRQNVKLHICLIKHYAMKKIIGSGSTAADSGRFTPGDIHSGIYETRE
jgi:hypothetical protein